MQFAPHEIVPDKHPDNDDDDIVDDHQHNAAIAKPIEMEILHTKQVGQNDSTLGNGVPHKHIRLAATDDEIVVEGS